MNRTFLRTVASRTATAVGAATIAAVVVAGSLSLAQAATEVGIPNNSVTSPKIVDGAVQGIDIMNHTITGSDIATSVVSPPIFAKVSAAGVLGANERVFSSANVGTGIYTLDFSREISDCAPVVTPSGAAGRSAVVNEFTPTELEVELSDAAGTLINVDFSIAVIC